MVVLVCTVANKRDDTNYDAWWLVCTGANEKDDTNYDA